MTAALRLRKLCDGYPIPVVVDAIRLALADSIADEVERTEITALIVHWLSAPDETEHPPISNAVVDAVRQLLIARAH